MADPWKSVLFELPANMQVVWIRVLNIYGEPVLAEYRSAQKTFTTQTTGIILNARFIARWKPQ